MYNKLPQFIEIKNEKFAINTDYRIFIEFEENMQGRNNNSAVLKALVKFYPAFLEIQKKGYMEEAVDKFIWFYFCGKELRELKTPKKTVKVSQIYSYKYDADLIWSAFWMYGRMDISKQYVHWWKFKAIWNSLPSECEFVKIKSYRAYTGEDKDILELKEYYKLPETEAEIKDRVRREKIYEALK